MSITEVLEKSQKLHELGESKGSMASTFVSKVGRGRRLAVSPGSKSGSSNGYA
jgi:hypothetical protein